jgi:hypothetical protein
MKETIRQLRYSNSVLFWTLFYLNKAKYFLTRNRLSDEEYIRRLFARVQDYPLNLNNPKTLNEKLQWLKLNDRKPIYTLYADKFAVRDYMGEHFGQDILIPLLFHTTDYRDINKEKLPDAPFIIKANHGFGANFIVRDKSKVDWKKLRTDCRLWLMTNYYYNEREWQYFNIKPRLVVEKLLLTSNGRIPDDFKLHCINGQVQFIYVSVDREGMNKRNIYDKQWQPLYFTWNRKGKDIANLRGAEIQPPQTLGRMIQIAEKIAEQFKYVRVDFYDVDSKLYFGEITQCHGGGFDQILPVAYDYKFGEMIDLPLKAS